MAYFPNGTAADAFESRFCSRCIHSSPTTSNPADGAHGTACPVMLAHVLYSYDLCNEKEHPGKVMLDLLIDDEKDTCTMFVPASFVQSTEWRRP